MSESQVLRVVIKLYPGETINGYIQVGGAVAQHFHGWLDLSNKLEHLRTVTGLSSLPEAAGQEQH